MAVSKGVPSSLWEEDQIELARHYFNVTEFPCTINAPYREDKVHSLGLVSDGVKVGYKDFATGEQGDICSLILKSFNQSQIQPLKSTKRKRKPKIHSKCSIEVKVREWQSYDIEYWESFGISIDWLKFAEVYPISHFFIIKDDVRQCYATEKYAYAYVERKEDKVTYKIYQPKSKTFKWLNNHDNSVIALWTKVPEKGKLICICSSVKDALCLWANTGIPSIAVQGEGYGISTTALNVLKERYVNVVICFDIDEPGIKDARSLSQKTGLPYVVLPSGYGKDISDIYKTIGNKSKFQEILAPVFLDYCWE